MAAEILKHGLERAGGIVFGGVTALEDQFKGSPILTEEREIAFGSAYVTGKNYFRHVRQWFFSSSFVMSFLFRPYFINSRFSIALRFAARLPSAQPTFPFSRA